MTHPDCNEPYEGEQLVELKHPAQRAFERGTARQRLRRAIERVQSGLSDAVFSASVWEGRENWASLATEQTWDSHGPRALRALENTHAALAALVEEMRRELQHQGLAELPPAETAEQD